MLAIHDSGHFIPNIFKGFRAVHQIGKGIDLFTLIVDIKGAIDNTALFFFEVIMNGVSFHGKFGFFTFFKGQVSDILPVFFGAGIDKHAVRTAKNDGVGNLESSRLVFNLI